MRPTVLASAILTTFIASSPSVSGREEFVARIPNGANVPDVKALGHVDPNGDGARNAFGEGFDEAGYAWTAEFCQADSDGDGQTNGQELGDPCCEFNPSSNAVVRWTEGVSHPGDSSLTSDSSLWASIDCSNVTSTATNATGSSYEDSSDVEVGDHDKDGSADASDDDTDGSSTTSTSAASSLSGFVVASAMSLTAITAALM